MKANVPKRKILDALDMMMSDMVQAETGNGLQSLSVDKIKPFHDHLFHLYDDESLQDMVKSIWKHGVFNPVIVQRRIEIMKCCPVITNRTRQDHRACRDLSYREGRTVR